MKTKTIVLFAFIQFLSLQSVFSQSELTFDSVFTIQIQPNRFSYSNSINFVVQPNSVYKITSVTSPSTYTASGITLSVDGNRLSEPTQDNHSVTPYWLGPGIHTLEIYSTNHNAVGFINGIKFRTD